MFGVSMYITSQVLVFVGLLIDLVGRCFKHKKQILFFNVTASLFYVSSYLFLQSWLGAIANGLNLLRNIWYMRLDEEESKQTSYILPACLITSLFVISLGIFWKNALDLVLLLSMLLVTIGFSFKNVLVVRWTIVVNSIVWGIYNFSIAGYVNFACDMIGLTIALVSIIYYHYMPHKMEQNKVEKTHK